MPGKWFKSCLIILLLTVVQLQSQANIRAIRLANIPNGARWQAQFNWVLSHRQWMDHWQSDWTYPIPREKVSETVLSFYSKLSSAGVSGAPEAQLLLGDLAHYLYNLGNQAYYTTAVQWYLKATDNLPGDYRAPWFLGNHYALSAKPVQAVAMFQSALRQQPDGGASADFWEDYANASLLMGMYPTAAYACGEGRKKARHPIEAEKMLKPILHDKIKPVPADTTIQARDLWINAGKADRQQIIVNDALGLQMLTGTNVGLEMSAYNDGSAYIQVRNTALSYKIGKQVSYSIMVMVRRGDKDSSLQSFLDLFTVKYPNRQPTYARVGNASKTLGYAIKDDSTYRQLGGGRMIALAVERDEPEYPGLALDRPMDMRPEGDRHKVMIYRSAQRLGRVHGKLRYLILLDAATDIDPVAVKNFQQFVSHLRFD